MKRLCELDGGGLSDNQIAEMVSENAAIKDRVGSKTQHIRALRQFVRFAGDYGNAECRRMLQELRSQHLSEPEADAIETAFRQIGARLVEGVKS